VVHLSLPDDCASSVAERFTRHLFQDGFAVPSKWFHLAGFSPLSSVVIRDEAHTGGMVTGRLNGRWGRNNNKNNGGIPDAFGQAKWRRKDRVDISWLNPPPQTSRMKFPASNSTGGAP
jgi:hypothetical protein